MNLDSLRGGDVIQHGLADLQAGRETEASLLVLIGEHRLRRLGIDIPARTTPSEDPHAEHKLYVRLAEKDQDSAHSRYNALLRVLVSFIRAAGVRELAGKDRIERFMRAIGAAATEETSIYFTGGATAVLLGWRASTIAVDIEIVPDRDEILRVIPSLKESLRMNVELASPSHFIPVLPKWRERSLLISREGKTTFYHYDLYAQALSKIERGHDKDRADLASMLRGGRIEPARLRELFESIVPQMYRYPALDVASFRRAVDEALTA